VLTRKHVEWLLPALVGIAGATLLSGIYAGLGALTGIVLGEGLAWLLRRRREAKQGGDQDRTIIKALMAELVTMGDTLQEVSMDSLQQRGGWDRALFDDVLTRVEQQTPAFHGALIDYLRRANRPRSGRTVAALLAVHRLSAAYTYWTRLFPPARQEESMFVLSLLHDLSEKVEDAIRLLGQGSTKP